MPKVDSNQARAVGFRLSLSHLILPAGEENKKALALLPRRCDVLVDSADSNTLRDSGVRILHELWSNGISAELVSKSRFAEDDINRSHRNDEFSWVVTLRYDSDAIESCSIKVRNTAKKEDTDVILPELVQFLKSEIRERNKLEQQADSKLPKMRKELSFGERAGPSGEMRDIDVRVLSPLQRSKKSSGRRQNADISNTKVRDRIEGFMKDTPVISVEVSDEFLDSVRDIRLSDADAWKTLGQIAEIQDKKYVQQINEALKGILDEGKAGAFLVNPKTKSCVYYDINKNKGKAA